MDAPPRRVRRRPPLSLTRLCCHQIAEQRGYSQRAICVSVSAQAWRILRGVLGGAVSVLAEEPSPAVALVAALAAEAVEHHLECRLRTPGLLDRYALR